VVKILYSNIRRFKISHLLKILDFVSYLRNVGLKEAARQQRILMFSILAIVGKLSKKELASP
jgi:hypothetical protein